MRKQLHDMTVETGHGTEDAPVAMWRESCLEWGNRVCAVDDQRRGIHGDAGERGLEFCKCLITRDPAMSDSAVYPGP